MAWVLTVGSDASFYSRNGNTTSKLASAQVYKTASGAGRALARRVEEGSYSVSELGVKRVSAEKQSVTRRVATAFAAAS